METPSACSAGAGATPSSCRLPPGWTSPIKRANASTATSRMAEFWAATDFLYDPAEKLYFRDSRFFERRDEQGPQALLEPRQRLGVRRHREHARPAAARPRGSRATARRCSRKWRRKLKAVQKTDGYWAPSLLGAENSPTETSGTGFFVYGLAWGVNRGLLASRGIPAVNPPWVGCADARGGARMVASAGCNRSATALSR